MQARKMRKEIRRSIWRFLLCDSANVDRRDVF